MRSGKCSSLVLLLVTVLAVVAGKRNKLDTLTVDNIQVTNVVTMYEINVMLVYHFPRLGLFPLLASLTLEMCIK